MPNALWQDKADHGFRNFCRNINLVEFLVQAAALVRVVLVALQARGVLGGLAHPQLHPCNLE